MALKLYRLAGAPTPKITTSQVGHQYFRSMTDTVAIAAAQVYSLKASTWFNSAGTSVAHNGLVSGQANQTLFVNGVLQQAGLYKVTKSSVQLTGPAGGMTLHKNYPVTLATFNTNAYVSTTKTFAIR